MINVVESLKEVATIQWLESILFERFGLSLTLENRSGVLFLTLDGHEGVIEFVSDGSEFGHGRSNVPFSLIDIDSEGLSSFIPGALPAPGLARCTQLLQKVEGGYKIHFNILAFIYWMLNRVEEVGSTDLDSHGRFPATSSHAFKNDYLSRPVVDEWLFVLGQVFLLLWPQITLRLNEFRMAVSHDVDIPGRYSFASAYKLLRRMSGDFLRRDIRGVVVAPLSRLGSGRQISKLDPANTFEWIMDTSEANNIKSAFYFICGRTAPSLDGDYEIEHPAIRVLLRRIHARGHEIGLHPSYNTYRSPALIQAEFDRLKAVCSEEGIHQDIWGGRMHYLRWEHPTTMLAWNEAKFSYDSTLGYADIPGFRCGTCFEYPGFDPITHTVQSVRIRPLIAMEVSILDKPYLGLGATEAAYNKFKELKDRCRAAGGVFSILWHNSNFSKKEEFELYARILAC